MLVTSVINYKGGVGKTVVTANLAAELAWRGYKVLLLDLDPQASLTFSFITPETWKNKYADDSTIKAWFDALSSDREKPLQDIIIQPRKVNGRLRSSGRGGLIDLIPSHLGLINVDLELATELGGVNLRQAKAKYLKVHGQLAKGLRDIDQEQYDLILIDCPPNFNIVTKNAIVASDNILIPAKPDYLSTMGIDYLIRSLNELVSDYNEFAKLNSATSSDTISPKILAVVFTMVQIYGGQPISAMRPFMDQTKKLSVPAMKSHIRENKTLFADAPQFGVPVVLNAYAAGTHNEVARGLEAFVAEFIKKAGI